MMNKPDVSIVVCTLNEEKRIQACLEHLANQHFSGSMEVILADGCSNDRTVEFAKPLVDKIVLEPVRRVSAERQAGARAAKGKILLFTDADSIAPPNWVQSFWDAFQRNRNASCVYGPVFLHDVPPWEQRVGKVIMRGMLRACHVTGNFLAGGANLGVRRTAFEQSGGFNTNLVTCEDLDLAKRLQSLGSLVYDSHVVTFVSARRIKKWGYHKFVFFHLANGFQYHWFGKARKEYEEVR